jgi:hypothetical protein
MPAFEPVSKNLANPLCLNPRITRLSVTQNVTGHKTPNAGVDLRPPQAAAASNGGLGEVPSCWATADIALTHLPRCPDGFGRARRVTP